MGGVESCIFFVIESRRVARHILDAPMPYYSGCFNAEMKDGRAEGGKTIHKKSHPI